MAAKTTFDNELTRLKSLKYLLESTTSVPEQLKLVREAKEAVELAIMLLETPHPKDTVLLNAIAFQLLSIAPTMSQIPGRTARYWIKDQQMFDTSHDMLLELFGPKFEQLELKNDHRP